ncbi:MAG: dihydrodipicolinate synthase family protein [Nitrososphaerota archaeon]|nr:dihydrodipicolinate synthase family protein [Nitrososphaerota archaeon]
MKRGRFGGIWSPMPTPLDAGGSVDVGRLRTLVDHLVEGGIDGLLPLGTSGEFALLTREEKKTVMETVVAGAAGRVPVVVGISDTSLADSVALAGLAEDAGADAVIATPPYYYTTDQEGIYRYYAELHRRIALPLMVYNIPEWTHDFVSPEVVARLSAEGAIVGMKYTEYNLFNLLKFIEAAKGRISIFTGSDAMAWTNLEFGGSGAIIGVANLAPRTAASIYDEFVKGDAEAARKAQVRLLPAIEAEGVGHFPAGLKEAMRLVGMPVGNVKNELYRLTDEERARVKRLMDEAGLTGGSVEGGA